jgi:hypothetical protein
MPQIDVYEFLRSERIKGNDDFISIKKVYENVLDMKNASITQRRTVWRCVRQLRKYGYLEVRQLLNWPSYMRLKDEYVNDRKVQK